MKDDLLLHLEKEFNELQTDLQRFQIALIEQIKEIAVNEKLEFGFPIQTRIKQWTSIKDKIISKRVNVKKSILELQDLIGVRVIMLSLQDVVSFEKVVQSDFLVLRNYNPIDKLNSDQFGYNSIHYILNIPESWKNVPSFKKLITFKFELQIRTLSQHIWAETSSAFNYKNVENVPRDLLRGIGRVSALLETVDFEISRLIEERKNYLYKIEEDNYEDKESLNIDLVERIFSQFFGDRETTAENMELVFKSLLKVSINTPKNLKELFTRHKTNFMKEETQYLIKIKNETPTELGEIFLKRKFAFDYLGIIRYILRKEDGF